jgi:2-hydroxychromene-2-carboxylate isomerase
VPSSTKSDLASESAKRSANRFYFDLASPSCWLVAERVLSVVPQPCEWVPVLSDDPLPAFRCAEESDIWRVEFERRAAAAGLQPVRWPQAVPFDSTFAMRAATFAAGAGKTVAFALAAFRQAYAGGRDLSDPENVLVAAAACEIHPRALLKGAALSSVAARLQQATADAPGPVPAIVVDGRVYGGEDAPELAAA